MIRTLFTLVFLFEITLHNNLFAQEYKLLEIRNCQNEMRTVTFQNQVSFFSRWAWGWSDIRKQRILNFSPNYKVDTSFLQSQIEKIRLLIPKGFGSSYPSGFWYDNVPDEPSIWFTVVFVKQDKQGNISAFAAYRISFEGNNAHLDEQRINPKISNVEFIFDKAALTKLAQRLKTLPESKG